MTGLAELPVQVRVLLGFLVVGGLIGLGLRIGSRPVGAEPAAEASQASPAELGRAGPITPADQRAARQLLITFQADPPSLDGLAAELGISPDDLALHPGTGVVTVTVWDPELRNQVRERSLALAEVESIEDDALLAITATPNDANYASQRTALEQIRAPEAWDYVQGKTTAKIAIIDTGIDGTHEDLSGKILAGRNVMTDADLAANTDSDDNGHGTSVAGVAAASGNNSLGVAGVDWRAKLVPVKAFDSSGMATTSDVVEALTYAIDAGVHVISMSFGRGTESAALTSALDQAWSRGIVLVAASGNDSTNTVSYPAASEHVLAVGSVGSSDARSSFSNYGANLDLMAPGESIYTTKDGGGYTTLSGTSLATPFVAGGVMVVKDFHSSAGNQEIVDILLSTARQVSGGSGRTDETGWGILNLQAAIRNAGNYAGEVVSWSSSGQEGAYPRLSGTDPVTITIRYRNTGRTRWFRNVVNLGTVDRDFNFRLDSEPLASGWLSTNRPATLTEASVAPSEIGTFTFQLANPGTVAGGSYRLDVGLVADGIAWFPAKTHAYWDITVSPAYDAQVVAWSSSAGDFRYPTLAVGQSSTMTIRYRNTGTATWRRGAVNLGTVDRDYNFSFSTFPLASNWVSANRPATLTEASVAPGETGTFTFQIRNSGTSSGTQRLDVGLVADGIAWFPRTTHAYWDIAGS
ncbi:S8 family serine peptidase [Candidatus Berkelbacteria bacterium]|nr:S8 family serine peptidase [Candidatus Berkelbacteria bacterium]